MRLCERSEAISLARGPLPGDCRVASLLAMTHKSEVYQSLRAQRGKVFAMTAVFGKMARLNCGTEFELAAIAETSEPEAG